MRRRFLINSIVGILLLSGCVLLSPPEACSEKVSVIRNADGSIDVLSMEEISGIDLVFSVELDEEALYTSESVLRILSRDGVGSTRVSLAKREGNFVKGERLVRIAGPFSSAKGLLRSSESFLIPFLRFEEQASRPFQEGISIKDDYLSYMKDEHLLIHAKGVLGIAGSEISITYDPSFLYIDSTRGNNGVTALNSYNQGLTIVRHSNSALIITSAFADELEVSDEAIYLIHVRAMVDSGISLIGIEGRVCNKQGCDQQIDMHNGFLRVGGPILLGDFDTSRVVDLPDFISFARVYGSSHEDPGYEEVFDIAPAEDSYDSVWKGIYDSSQPDGSINLLDFIVFARNYGKVRPNEPPFLSIPDQRIVLGEILDLHITDYAIDPDGDDLVFSLLEGSQGSVSGSSFTYESTGVDPYEITAGVAVVDSSFNRVTDSFKILATNPNNIPVFASIPDQYVSEGGTVMFSLLDYASDADGDDLSFEIVSGVGHVSGSSYMYYPDYESAGSQYVVVKAIDGKGGEALQGFLINVSDVNRSPSIPSAIMPSPGAIVFNLQDIELVWECNDPDGDELIYDLYFGETNSMIKTASTLETRFTLGRIEDGKTYSWKVIVSDSAGSTEESPVFEFSTDFIMVPGGEFEGRISTCVVMTKDFSPFTITGDVIVEQPGVLIIEPGVELRFRLVDDPSSNGKEDLTLADLIVFGRLEVLGTEEEPVVFTSDMISGSAGDWGGIRFSKNQGKSVIQNAVIQYAVDGIWTDGECRVEVVRTGVLNCFLSGIFVSSSADVSIDHCTVQFCGTGVKSEGSLNAIGSSFRNNSSHGIKADSGTVNLYECDFSFNESNGIYSGFPTLLSVFNSIFMSNRGYAIEGFNILANGCYFGGAPRSIAGGKMILNNNTFSGEFGLSESLFYSGITIYGETIMEHNYIEGFSNGLTISTDTSVEVLYNLISGNKTGVRVEKVGINRLKAYNNNIYSNHRWNIFNNSPIRVAFENTFWGSDNPEMIIVSNYGSHYNPLKGTVDFSGYRSSLVNGGTSSKKIAFTPGNSRMLGPVETILVDWTAYKPEESSDLFKLYFDNAPDPEVFGFYSAGPVEIPVEPWKTYFIGVSLADDDGGVSPINEIYTGITKVFGDFLIDEGNSVIETYDNCFVIAGVTTNYMNTTYDQQVYLLKVDEHGNLLWERNYGSPFADCGYCVIETSDGGLVVTGYKDSSGSGKQLYLMKTDSCGNLLWEREFKFTTEDIGYCLVEATNCDLIVVGSSCPYPNNSQVSLLRTDSWGNLLWWREYGGLSCDSGYGVIETLTGDIVLTGKTILPDSNQQVYLVKTNAGGNLIWEKNFGEEGFDQGNDLIETIDGSYAIAGTSSNEGNIDSYILKTDSSGSLLWHRLFGGPYYDNGNSIFETEEGDFVVAGRSYSCCCNDQLYLLRMKSDGELIWEARYGGSNAETGYSIIETSNGFLAIAGYSESYGSSRQVYFLVTDRYGRGLNKPGW